MAGLSSLIPDPRDIPLSNPLAGFDPSGTTPAAPDPMAEYNLANQTGISTPQFPDLGVGTPQAPGAIPTPSPDQFPTPELPFNFQQLEKQANAQPAAKEAAAAKAAEPPATGVFGGAINAVRGAIEPWMSLGFPTAYASPFPSAFFSNRTEYFHQTAGEYGNDFGMPVGTPIRAPWDGTIRWEQSGKQNWGNRIFVTGGHGWTFAVGHLTSFAVRSGQQVKAGQIIGFSGGATSDPNSGNTTGPHIEPQLINPRGQYVDPFPWLTQIYGKGVAPGANPANYNQPGSVGSLLAGAQATAQAQKKQADVIYGPGSTNPYTNLLTAQPAPAPVASARVGARGIGFSQQTLHPTTPSPGGSPLDFLAQHVPQIGPGGISFVDRTKPAPPAPAVPPADQRYPFDPSAPLTLRTLEGQPFQMPQWVKDTDPTISRTPRQLTDPQTHGLAYDAKGNPKMQYKDAKGQLLWDEQTGQQNPNFDPTSAKPVYDIGPPNPVNLAGYPLTLATATTGRLLAGIGANGNADQINKNYQGVMAPLEPLNFVLPSLHIPEITPGLTALRAALQGEGAEPSLPGLRPSLGQRLNIESPKSLLTGNTPKPEAPAAAPAPRDMSGQQLNLDHAAIAKDAEATAAQLGVRDFRIPPTPELPPGPYHGTSKPIAALQVPYELAQAHNLYGPGFYTTDAIGTARHYANTKGSGTEHPVYAVSWVGEKPPVFLDLEKPLPLDAVKAIDDASQHDLFDRIHSTEAGRLESMAALPGKELYAHFRSWVAANEIPVPYAEEIFMELADRLQQLGYDGFRHIGGGPKGGTAPHLVSIFFSPINEDTYTPNLKLTEVPPGARLRAGAGSLGFMGTGDLQQALTALAQSKAVRAAAGAIRGAAGAVVGSVADTQGIKELAAVAKAGLWGGFANRGHALLQELASTPPDEVADVARQRIEALNNEANSLSAQLGNGGMGQLKLNIATDPAEEALVARLAHVDLTRGVYVAALKRVLGGYSHELAPEFRAVASTIRNPYLLRSGVVNFPTDANLAVRYNTKATNVVVAIGQRIANKMEKLFPDSRVRETVWQAIENPGAPGLNPKIVEMAKAINLLFDDVGLYLADERGMFDALRQNYYPRIIVGFKDPVTGKVTMGRKARDLVITHKASPLNTDSPRFHGRSIQGGLDELESRGWIVQKDPAQAIPLYMKSVARAIGNDNILNFIKTAVIARTGEPAYIEGTLAKGGPKGYRHLFIEGEHPAAPKLSGFIHKDIADQLDYQFQPGQHGTAFRAFQMGGEIFREGVMINPLFHGLNQLSHQLMHTMVPPRLWVQGHYKLKDPEVLREVATYTAYRPHRAATDFNQALDNVAAGVPRWRFGQDWKGIPSPIRYAVDKSHTLLFDFIVGNAQAMIYLESRDKMIALGMDPEQARLAAGAKADRIVGMQDPSTKSKLEREIAPLVFFAPNWTKTHVLQPFESTPGLGKVVLQKEHPYLTPEAAGMLNDEMTWATVRGIVSSQLYAQILNTWSSGHSTFQNEQGRSQDWDITQWARDRLGYRGAQKLYIEFPTSRFNNWYLSGLRMVDNRGGLTPGGIGKGLSDFAISKTMPPLSIFLQMLTDQSAPTDNAAVIKALESLFPLDRQLQAMTGDQVIGPNSLAKLNKAITDLREGNISTSPEAQRLVLALAAFGLGENPPKRGPALTSTLGGANRGDITHEWMVGLELARQGVNPAVANADERAKAIAVVEQQPDPEGTYEALNTKYEKTQDAALTAMGKEMGVDLSQKKQDEYRAQGLNPMDLLDAVHKAEIFQAHPELELWHQAPSRDPDAKVRAVQSDNAAYHVVEAQIQDKATLDQQADDLAATRTDGTGISLQTWRDRRIRRLDSLYNKDTGALAALLKAHPNAIIDRASYDKFLADHGKPPRGITRFDAAYLEYKNIDLDNPKFTLPDGTQDVLAWKSERDDVLAGLPQDQVDYIKGREAANWTHTGPINEFLYHQLTNEYLSFEQQHADAVHLYHQMYQQTDTPLARKLFEAQHPQLFSYIIQRSLWFRQHPTAALFFEHGYGLQKTLMGSGVNPFDPPAEQIATLLRYPRLSEPLDLSFLNQQPSLPAAQSTPAQRGALAQTLYQNP